MTLDEIRDHFFDAAPVYDERIVRLIPGYRDQHEHIRSRLAAFDQPVRRALDLGCGTGALAELVLATFPAARVVLFDLTAPMLEQAAARLAAHRDRLTFRQGDFATDDFGSGYDLVLSGLAIHHLTDADKEQLYRRIFAALEPGGLFLNRDVVRLATPELTRAAEIEWCEFMRGNGEDADHFFALYQREDIPATVADQLRWLDAAGFTGTGCGYLHRLGAVFGGRKPR